MEETDQQVQKIKDQLEQYEVELTAFELQTLTKHMNELIADCERFASDFPEVKVNYADVANSIQLWYSATIHNILQQKKNELGGWS